MSWFTAMLSTFWAMSSCQPGYLQSWKRLESGNFNLASDFHLHRIWPDFRVRNPPRGFFHWTFSGPGFSTTFPCFSGKPGSHLWISRLHWVLVNLQPLNFWISSEIKKCLWLVYDWFMTDLLLIYDWFMADLWLIHNGLMTILTDLWIV